MYHNGSVISESTFSTSFMYSGVWEFALQHEPGFYNIISQKDDIAYATYLFFFEKLARALLCHLSEEKHAESCNLSFSSILFCIATTSK